MQHKQPLATSLVYGVVTSLQPTDVQSGVALSWKQLTGSVNTFLGKFAMKSCKKKPMTSPSSCYMDQQEPVNIFIKFYIREIH
jgi:hypothetical protein